MKLVHRLIPERLTVWPNSLNAEGLSILFLYVFMLGGAFWHVLGAFADLMQLLAGPVIIVLALLLVRSYDLRLRSAGNPHQLISFYGWCLLVFIGSFLVEVAGVKTGLIFGAYQYGNILQPVLWGVPLAIGFAWLSMLLSTLAVVQRLLRITPTAKPVIFVLVSASIMVVFDMVMEPAAIKLDYWQWAGNSIPLQNFAAWFVLSLIFAWIAVRRGLTATMPSRFALHAFFAQLFYFGIVYLG